VERIPVHSRGVRYRGYHRVDGLWDIEAEIVDEKAYAITTRDGAHLAPGDPVHRMLVRLTLDDACVVQAIEAATLSAPYGECRQAVPPMQRMVGVQVGKGWRRAIEERLGGVQGCTHLRELLFTMATAALQTIPHYREVVLQAAPPKPGLPPAQLGQCLAWDADGPVVRRVAGEFSGWKP
jgi:hypothetical protein